MKLTEEEFSDIVFYDEDINKEIWTMGIAPFLCEIKPLLDRVFEVNVDEEDFETSLSRICSEYAWEPLEDMEGEDILTCVEDFRVFCSGKIVDVLNLLADGGYITINKQIVFRGEMK
jgi:hypothetical protein